jgi:hypothetical protein
MYKIVKIIDKHFYWNFLEFPRWIYLVENSKERIEIKSENGTFIINDIVMIEETSSNVLNPSYVIKALSYGKSSSSSSISSPSSSILASNSNSIFRKK